MLCIPETETPEKHTTIAKLIREKHIKSKEVRGLLYNIPNVDAFIDRQKASYIGKISRSNAQSYPKKFLAAWIFGKQKNGAPQLTCNNNFAKVI